MLARKPESSKTLHLRVGELVQIRTGDEILQTLDAEGRLDALPFMPEMLKFCGKRFRVVKRVDKICDTIDKTGFRRMKNAVLLEDIRCGGEAHGGCQASCMLLWKEDWLKRVSRDEPQRSEITGCVSSVTHAGPATQATYTIGCTGAQLISATRRYTTSPDDEIYVCQNTELSNATSPLASWDVRQYFRDFWSGNVSTWEGVRGLLILLFNKVQGIRGGAIYPHINQGVLTKTPSQTLDLKAGDFAEVKSKHEIWQTLDTNNKNRGLWYDVEMLKFCGQRFKVHGNVQKMINEKTGQMINFTTKHVLLEGVTCNGDCHNFCPRKEYIYWREVWLRKVAIGAPDYSSK